MEITLKHLYRYSFMSQAVLSDYICVSVALVI